MAEVQLNIADLVIRVKGVVGIGVSGVWNGGAAELEAPLVNPTVRATLVLTSTNDVPTVIVPGTNVTVSVTNDLISDFAWVTAGPWTVPANGSVTIGLDVTLKASRAHNDIVILRAGGVGNTQE